MRRLRAETAVEPCASLGLVREPELARLKAAGLMHYHHNLETARSHFDERLHDAHLRRAARRRSAPRSGRG